MFKIDFDVLLLIIFMHRFNVSEFIVSVFSLTKKREFIIIKSNTRYAQKVYFLIFFTTMLCIIFIINKIWWQPQRLFMWKRKSKERKVRRHKIVVRSAAADEPFFLYHNDFHLLFVVLIYFHCIFLFEIIGKIYISFTILWL